jgi:plastocyanin
MKRKLFIILFGLAALLLSACASAPSAVEFTVEMTEFAYSPETIEVSVGQEVTLHIENHGALAHELMIGRDVVEHDGQPANYGHNMFEGAEPMVMAADDHDDGDDHDDEGDDHDDEGDDHDDEGDDHDDEMDMEDDGHDEGEDDHAEDADGHAGEDHGFMVSLPGGTADSSTTVTFTVTEDMVGEWEIGCFLDGGSHYIAGMVGTFVVTP